MAIRGQGANLGSAVGSIELDASGARRGAAEAARAIAGIGGAATSAASRGVGTLTDALARLGTTAATVAAGGLAAGIAGLATALVAGVGTAKDFEQALAGIAAVSGASAAELRDVRALALQLGKDTAFTAKAAADAIGELVKGGVSIGEVLNGAAQATLDLAAAGGISLPEAAQIAANAMSTFGKRGSELAAVVDQIAGAANASTIDVRDFALSMQQAGSVVSTVGLQIEDLTQAIAVLGSRGLRGSDAGTSLKTFLLSLQPRSKAALATMRELGIVTDEAGNAFFDAQGKARSLAEIAGVLQRATSRLTQAQKLQALETIFGTDAIRAAAIFAETGAEGFGAMAAAIEKVKAADVARVRLDNLAGSIEQLKGSLETAAIRFGSLFVPAVRGMVDATTGQINRLIGVLEGLEATAPDILPAIGQAFARLTGSAADIGKLEGVLNRVFGEGSTLARGLPAALDALRQLGGDVVAGIGRFEQAIGLAGRPVATLASGLGELIRTASGRIFPPGTDDEIKTVGGGMAALQKSASLALSPVDRFVRLVREGLGRLQASEPVQQLAAAFGRLGAAVGPLLASLGRLAAVLLGPFIRALLPRDVADLGAALGGLEAPSARASAALELIKRALGGLAGLVNAAAGAVEQLGRWLGEVAGQVEASGAVERFRQALAGLAATLGGLLQPLGSFFDRLDKARLPDQPVRQAAEMVDAAFQMQQSFAEAAQQSSSRRAALLLVGVFEALTRAVNEFNAAVQASVSALDALTTRLAATGEGARGLTALASLGQSLANLVTAPLSGIAQGLELLDRAGQKADGIDRISRALAILTTVAQAAATVIDVAAGVIERLTFVIAKQVAALDRLVRGDLAGALAEIGTAIEALRFVQGPRLEANRIIDAQSFEKVRADIQRFLDFLADLNRGPAGQTRRVTVEVEAMTQQAEVRLLALRGQLDALPRSFIISAYVNTVPAQNELLRLSRMLPHSPAETGPLAFVPDWSFLTANLPEVLRDLIALVDQLGEQIGGNAQVEHFRAVAEALGAAAGAVGATVEQVGKVTAFVRPGVEALDDLAASLREVLARIAAIAGAFTAAEAERVQAVSGAAQAALGALGAAVEQLGKARDFVGPAIGRVADAVDHTAGLLARLRDLGQGFNPLELARIKLIGEAAQAAMGGLGAAIEPLTRARSFVGPAIGQVADLIDHVSGVLVRLDQLALAFTADQLQRARALGEAVQAAMGGLSEAVTALAAVRRFTGFDPGLFEGLFSLIANVAVRFRDLSLAFGDEQARQAEQVAGAVREAFGALGQALEVLPKLAGARVPDVAAALERLLEVIRSVVAGIDRVAVLIGQEAAARAGEFSEAAGRVVDLLGRGVDAFARLGDLQEVSEAQLRRFGAGVALAVQQLAVISRQVGALLSDEAVAFAERTERALGLLGAAASLSQLNEFVAPGRRQFERFFAALSVAVDGLVAEGQRVAPEIARRTGEVGEQLGRAIGGVGTAVQAFVNLQAFQPGKGFEQKLAGMLDLVRRTVEQMRALAAGFGDLRQLDAFARTVEQVARALSAVIAAATGAGEVKGIDRLAELVTALTGTVAPIALRTEHVVRFEGGFTIRAEGFAGADQRVAGEVSEAVKDEIIARAVLAVGDAARLAFGVTG